MNNWSEAEITYDSNKLTQESLPELIVKLNPKKFKVGNKHTTRFFNL